MSGRCGACGALGVRKRQRAYVSDGPGLLRAALVCSSCIAHACTFVPVAPVLRCHRGCGNPAKVCVDCAHSTRAQSARELLEPAIRLLRGIQKGLAAGSGDSEFVAGKVEGLDTAIAVLESEGQGRRVLAPLSTATTTRANDTEGDSHG